MKNTTDYDSSNIHPEVFSLDKFFESDAPGALSWLNMEDIECSSVVPSFNNIKLNKQLIPCQRLCTGCRRWQIESSGRMDFPDIINPANKLNE